VESSWSQEGGRRRRVYALTEKGREAALANRREWRSFSAAVSAVFDGGGLAGA
jgi:DNA-binding PadR family transcriptional regulator